MVTALGLACVPSAQSAGPAALPNVAENQRLIATDKLISAQPAEVGMSGDISRTLDSIITVALAEHAAPGASIAVGRYGRLIYLKGFGRLDTAMASAPVDANTMYDMASLTKVIATTTAAMVLEEQGTLDLDRTVASYLPGFNAPDKTAITMRMVLTHRGGLEAFAALFKTFRGRDQYLEQINLRPLKSGPGTETVYSDWDMILTQLVIEKITGMSLDRFVQTTKYSALSE